MPANDPWLWTVDDLVAEVCHSNALFTAAGYSAPHTPDFARLEEQIRSRGVTGEAFLTALNHNAIVKRNELNIPRLRQREALMSVVQSLRLRSYIYKQHTAITDVDSLKITSADNSRSTRSIGISNDVAVADEAGRKRRKITHLSTTPLQNTHPDSHSQQTTNTAAIGPSHPALSNTDEYAHLLRWQNVVGDEHIIDLPDEDDLQEDENYRLGNVAEEDSRSLEDDDDDVVEEPSKRTKLSQDEIVDIINERIAFYTNTWKPNKGVARGEEVDYDPVTMWNEAEAEGEREVLAQKCESDRIYYRSRLDGLCDQIVKFPGSNAVSHDALNMCMMSSLTVTYCRSKYGDNAATLRLRSILWSLQLGYATSTSWNPLMTAMKSKCPTIKISLSRATNRTYDELNQLFK